MCPSPSAHSDSSSGNGRLSSAGSEPGTLRYLFYVYHLQTSCDLDIIDVMLFARIARAQLCNIAVIHLFFSDFVNDKNSVVKYH